MTPPAAEGRLSRELSHIWTKFSGRRARAQRLAKRAFAEVLAALGPDDIAIDLGANAGEFTRPMAETGARVFAFEPDPHALRILRSTVAEFDNVTIIPAAAGAVDGTATLYRRKDFDSEPDRASKSSSLMAEKRNVVADHGLDVEMRDFAGFLQALDHDVALVKMDIEGAEVPVLERLFDSGAADRIGHIFVETHERALPHLADRMAQLKARAARRDAPVVNWDWH